MLEVVYIVKVFCKHLYW